MSDSIQPRHFPAGTGKVYKLGQMTIELKRIKGELKGPGPFGGEAPLEAVWLVSSTFLVLRPHASNLSLQEK